MCKSASPVLFPPKCQDLHVADLKVRASWCRVRDQCVPGKLPPLRCWRPELAPPLASHALTDSVTDPFTCPHSRCVGASVPCLPLQAHCPPSGSLECRELHILSSFSQALVSQNLNTGYGPFCTCSQRLQRVRVGGAGAPGDRMRWGLCQTPGNLQLCEFQPFMSALSRGQSPRAPASLFRGPEPPCHPMWAACRQGFVLCACHSATWREMGLL